MGQGGVPHGFHLHKAHVRTYAKRGTKQPRMLHIVLKNNHACAQTVSDNGRITDTKTRRRNPYATNLLERAKQTKYRCKDNTLWASPLPNSTAHCVPRTMTGRKGNPRIQGPGQARLKPTKHAAHLFLSRGKQKTCKTHITDKHNESRRVRRPRDYSPHIVQYVGNTRQEQYSKQQTYHMRTEQDKVVCNTRI